MEANLKPAAKPRFSEKDLPALLFQLGAALLAVAGFRWWFLQNPFGPYKQLLVLGGAVVAGGAFLLDGRFGGQLRAEFREAIGNRIQFLNWLAVAVPFTLLTMVIREFHIGPRVFNERISVVLLVGVLIHSLLPRSFRLSWFLFVSLVVIFGSLGLQNSLWLLGLGVVLIGACHVPVRFPLRILLVLLVAAVLAAFRGGWLPAPWSSAIWPVLGAMFAFRLIVYLYDLQHLKESPDWRITLSYFFLLPTAAFPLFPVIDYKAFQRSYGNAESLVTRQVGLRWILRGTIHVALYRFVYLYLTISPTDVANLSDLLRFLISNFALYLRVSGYFHLVIGILHLFGFNLPETNHRYFLASSFTDFWRRINIYWKEFMMKVFYYPAYFRLRRLGETPGLVLATALVFLVTWFLHAYQWFWMRGTFLLSLTDSLFWTILGALMIGNTLWEAKFGRRRVLSKSKKTPAQILVNGLKIMATFLTIAVLWSLWSSTSLQEWWAMWSFRGQGSPVALGWPAILLLLGMLGAATLLGEWGLQRKEATSGWSRFGPAASVAMAAAALLMVAHRDVRAKFDPQIQGVLRDLRVDKLNQQDAALLHRGYYENLVGVERLNSPLADLYTAQPVGCVPLIETEVNRFTRDFLVNEARPFASIVHRGALLTTNRWGIRDLDYEKQKAPGTLRIALLGASHEMGTAVADQANWEALLERKLNQDLTRNGPVKKYEIWNFSVGGYSPLQRLWTLEKKVAEFNPDVVLYVARDEDFEFTGTHLATLVREKIPVPYPYLQEIIARSGVSPATPRAPAESKFRESAQEIEGWVSRQIAELSRQRGFLPVWAFVPSPGTPLSTNHEGTVRMAREAGLTVIDLKGLFDHMDPRSLHVAAWDYHTNEAGHKIVAEKMFAALRDQGVLRNGTRPQ